MSAVSPDWSACLQREVMATTNEDLQCLLRAANTPEERWRLIELLMVLGARTAIQMLENNDVPCARGTLGSLQHGHSPNSCAECSFQEVKSLLEDAVMFSETAGHVAREAVQEQTASEIKADPEQDKRHQTYMGCVGKSFTSSLRVMKGRKARTNRHANEASPTSDSTAHRSTPLGWQQEPDPPRLPTGSQMSEFCFDNRFVIADGHTPKQYGRRRALDYGRQARSSFELDPEEQVTPGSTHRLQQSHPGQRLRSVPATARRAAPSAMAFQASPQHTGRRGLSGPGTPEMRHEDNEGPVFGVGRARTPSMIEDAGQNHASEHLPEVVFADTGRSSQAQLPNMSPRDRYSGDPQSVEMARQALLRGPCSSLSQGARQQGRHRRKLMNLLSLSKHGTQPNLIPSSASDQPWSVGETEISCALQGLGSIMASTAASALQNPADLDHTDAFSQVDSSELVTVRGAPRYALAGHVDAA